MENTPTDLQYFAETLYNATDFNEAFQAYENSVEDLGFAGVLYTFIPKALLESNFSEQPVYEVSRSFSQPFLNHYAEARFDKHDPMIQAVNDGSSQPIDWWGDTAESYTSKSADSLAVMETARDYGIQNGVTIPLMSGTRGISGASIISDEKRNFKPLIEAKLPELKIHTHMFHNMVQTNALYVGRFVRPWLASLNKTELAFLAGLRDGKSPAQIAMELNRSEGYLEQVMLRMRRKMSGVGPDEKPPINRNQVMFYFGMMCAFDDVKSADD